jgi:hypothetical protein
MIIFKVIQQIISFVSKLFLDPLKSNKNKINVIPEPPKSRYISNMVGRKKWIDSDKLFFGVSKLIIFVMNDPNSTKPSKIDSP